MSIFPYLNAKCDRKTDRRMVQSLYALFWGHKKIPIWSISSIKNYPSYKFKNSQFYQTPFPKMVRKNPVYGECFGGGDSQLQKNTIFPKYLNKISQKYSNFSNKLNIWFIEFIIQQFIPMHFIIRILESS